MGERFLRPEPGAIAVTRLAPNIILCRGTGHLRRSHVLAAQAEIERLESRMASPVDALFDGSAIETYEPGLPMLWVTWFRGWTGRAGRVAIVGRAGPMLSVASTFRYLLPNLRFALFRDCVQAVAFLRQ